MYPMLCAVWYGVPDAENSAEMGIIDGKYSDWARAY